MLFAQFKAKVEANGAVGDGEAVEFANDLKHIVDEGVSRTDE